MEHGPLHGAGNLTFRIGTGAPLVAQWILEPRPAASIIEASTKALHIITTGRLRHRNVDVICITTRIEVPLEAVKQR